MFNYLMVQPEKDIIKSWQCWQTDPQSHDLCDF